MMSSPCYTCQNCPCKNHDRCPDYAEYQSKLEEARKERLRMSQAIGYVNQQIIKNKRKYKR